ncbi:MAG: reverse gyrase [Adlercreutzia sp.]|nr:reverse gyrase [Adlercreutzia sp.]
MKHCDRCHIDFTGELDRCPLCGTGLEGSAVPSPFPAVPFTRRSMAAQRVLLAVSIAVAAGIVALGIALGSSPLSVIAAVAAIALNYLFVRNMIAHAPDFLRLIERYFLVLLAVAALWFIATGNLAVTTFVIPGISLLAILFDAILVATFRGTFITDYAKYLIYDVILGAVPALSLALGQVTWPYLAWASLTAAALFLAALLLFTKGRFTREAKKLFSVR